MTSERREHRYSVTAEDGAQATIFAVPSELAAKVKTWRRQTGHKDERLTIIDRTEIANWADGSRG